MDIHRDIVYLLRDYYTSNIETWHGTGTAAIAAAQGNNAFGTTGICKDCRILATAYGYGSPGSILQPTPNFNNLLQLAINGARVINMSWRFRTTSPTGPIPSYQWVIDEIYESGVVLVAGAGNECPVGYNPPNSSIKFYGFPASYNHVISVTSVNSRFNLYEIYGVDNTEPTTSPFFNVPLSYLVKDMISPRVAPNYLGSGNIVPVTNDPEKLHTLNEAVDICAPGYEIFRYDQFIGLGQILYGAGTSGATPHVSGTIGLMLSLNDCLNPDEVEDVLQLTSKNLEHIQGNEPFVGDAGSGKLEAGDCLEFVYNMMNTTGNALIDGQDFWRFNFNLTQINNKLTISNQIFRDTNVSDFIAKNQIHLLPNTRISPNNGGRMNLSINPNITVFCQPTSRMSDIAPKEINNKENDIKNNYLLYPNPNNGTFKIKNINFSSFNNKSINIEVYDINGRSLYRDYLSKNTENEYDISLSNLSNGIYFVKLFSENYSSEIKFIKK